ncbi:MAG: dynamin family protein, partial [Acetobacterium sp.]|uniref:dynamin family protein n=1 Tax=Acetobacterium sp. TaxID=1872094 RepID=UPI003242D90C
LEEYKKRNGKGKPSQELSERDLEDRVIKKAKRQMKSKTELEAAFDQYEKMKSSGVKIGNLAESKIIEAKDLQELKSKLIQYVGSNGKYMPFTKSVHIKLPYDSLKDLKIVDTPGLNDPVQSREARTRELLKYCDVTFVVSPSGQFLSQVDMELMDRITLKEGISELFVVSSQIDNQLYGSEKEKANGNLHKALRSISAQLADQMMVALSDLKKNNQEIGNVFDGLIDDSRNHLVYTSGIAQTIKHSLGNLKELGDGEQKVWENLTIEYPDYFSETDLESTKVNLSVLANIPSLNEKVQLVRSKKDEIISGRRNEFLLAKLNNTQKYKMDLLDYAKEEKQRVENTEKDDIATQKSNLEKVKNKASSVLDEEYYDLIEGLKISLETDLNRIIKDAYKESKSNVEASEGEEESSYTTGHFWWKKTHYDTYATCRSGAVKNAIEAFKTEMEHGIVNKASEKILSFRKNMHSQLVSTLRTVVEDEELDPQLIRKAIRGVINSVELPEINLDNPMPVVFKAKGTLKDYEAEEFLNEANDYLNSLKKLVNKSIKTYVKDLFSALNGVSLSQEVFSNFNQRINELDNQIKNKTISLERFNQIIEKLS